MRVTFKLPDNQHDQKHGKPCACAHERQYPDKGVFEEVGYGHAGTVSRDLTGRGK